MGLFLCERESLARVIFTEQVLLVGFLRLYGLYYSKSIAQRINHIEEIHILEVLASRRHQAWRPRFHWSFTGYTLLEFLTGSPSLLIDEGCVNKANCCWRVRVQIKRVPQHTLANDTALRSGFQ